MGFGGGGVVGVADGSGSDTVAALTDNVGRDVRKAEC